MEIPVVELVVHPDLAQAAALLGSSSTARIDLDALGLSHRVRTQALHNSTPQPEQPRTRRRIDRHLGFADGLGLVFSAK
jgi:hypothetical protein